MSVVRPFATLLASVLLVATPVSSFAADASVAPSYQTGNRALDGIFADFERSVRSKGDNARLSNFLRESSGFRNGKISEGLRDEVLKNRIESVSKNLLANQVPSGVTTEQGRKTVISGLLWSMKKGFDDYRLFVKTALSRSELESALAVFGTAKLSESSRAPDGKDQYEIVFPSSGRYGKILGAQLDQGSVPASLFEGVEIVKPFVVESLVSTGTYLAGENLAATWGISRLGAQDYQYGLSQRAKVKVAILDTGVALTHPDLAANIAVNAGEIAANGIDDDRNGYVDDARGYNFYSRNANAEDDHGHGTHIAGVIGGRVNGAGVFGVNSNASIVPLKVLASNGYGSSYAIIDAINYAANNGVKVLNMSFGGSGTPSNDSICAAISSAKAKGVLSVVAAGNENADVSTKVPAGCADALTVSAVDASLVKASFSNYGTKVDVAAPGTNIYSTYLGGRYATMAGTSMATPFVAGLAAAAVSASPSSTPDQLRSLLKNTANTLPVTSQVNIGRFVSVPRVMASLGVQNDSLIGSGTGSGSTSSGSTSSGSTSSGSTSSGSTVPTTNLAPTLSVTVSKTATNAYLVSALASDADGRIVRYEYFNGSSLIASGSLTSVQVTVTANATVTVKVTDDRGASVSRSVTLAYQAPAVNAAPTVALASQIVSSRSVQVNFTAFDSDGTVASVLLYLNGRLVYSVAPNAARFSASLSLSRGNPVTVKVVAKDNKWAVTEKSIVVK